jgi:hypothetical protein
MIKIDKESRLVWDAGIGTIFSMLAFPMPYAQPRPVIESLLRRIIAIRLVLAGWNTEAAAQIAQSDRLLSETPIDRYYQDHADDESQFEVWLLTEMQECFIVGHELAHHLHAVDPVRAARFHGRVSDYLRTVQSTELRSIFVRPFNAADYELRQALRNRGLDEYDWFLDSWRQGRSIGHPTEDWRTRVSESIAVFESHTKLREEIACDLIAALAVSLDAHMRRRGWTALMGAACSRLALANLGLILGLDEWISQNSVTAAGCPDDFVTRQKSFDTIFPWSLAQMLRAHARDLTVDPGDVGEIVRHVGHLHEERLLSVLSGIDRLPMDPEVARLDSERLLLSAAFINLRPSASPSWRHSNWD